MAKTGFTLKARRVTVIDTLEAQQELAYERGWSDGLPIIPPTAERVRKMLAAVERDPSELIALIEPRNGKATLENIAINAVMAGCLPSYLPVVVAAVRAVTEPKFNLYGEQATTHATAPLLIINGPIARELEVNNGFNVLGQGWRANAAIGRAIRLIMTNTGGGKPGGLDRSTQGQPGKYTFCFAENEARNPWQPLHVELGFAPGDSTVTVVGAAGTYDINDRSSTTSKGLLHMLASSMAIMGSNNYMVGGAPIMILCPEHAEKLAADGLSKDDVKRYFFENTKLPAKDFPSEWYRDNIEPLLGDPNFIPLAQKPENIMIVVAGGPGHHSTCIPTSGVGQMVTRKIEPL